MNKYQVKYKYNTKTFVDDFYSLSSSNILEFFKDISACEIIEIREYLYENNIYKEDDNNYIHSASVTLQHENIKHTFKIPKLKKNIDDLELSNFIKTHLKVFNNTVENVKIKKTYT